MARNARYADAICLFNSLAEYSIDAEDYSTLQWLCDAPKPTEAELKGLLSAAQKVLDDETKTFEANKAAATAKLVALGLTADNLKALGL